MYTINRETHALLVFQHVPEVLSGVPGVLGGFRVGFRFTETLQYCLFVYFWRSKFEVQLFLKFANYQGNSWLLFAALYAD